MNKKFIVSTILLFIALMISSYVVHGVLLQDEYMAVTGIWRSEAEMHNLRPFMFLAHFAAALAIVWLYRKGKETKPFFKQGIRFGAAISLLYVGIYLIYYVILPLPWALVVKQMVFETVGTTLCCIALAWWESRK